jgi:hypothetical protein
MKTLIKMQLALVTLVAIIFPISTPAAAKAPIAIIMPILTPREYAQIQISNYDWNSAQFTCLDELWTKESHWNPKSDNPNSTAFGIAQMLGEDAKDAETQINNGLRYIEHRYDTPCNAWRYWRSHYWY